MQQTTSQFHTILEKLQRLTPEQQDIVITFIDFLQFQAQNTETCKEEQPTSFYQAAQEYIGCVDGGPGDLATNKDYLQSIGTP